MCGQGKKKAIRLFLKNDSTVEHLTTFCILTASKDDVFSAGEAFILSLYGGSKFKSLDDYRDYSYRSHFENNPWMRITIGFTSTNG